ncbi:A-agglutinin anchorage subunit-like isoform X1 [Sphaerodactylus townsendi]|uniref:A-agglutinin anchorage subunit-like isoform X1 n=1 Tax=Sphaerodactylus townsendi TaxID=933632 RepID=UPI0020265C5D|nr:A-agglutinin anchorage subunit-like isoform X1 [Sphaerodactylus townsendi]
MIKLLLLCLLATVVTMENDKPSDSSLTTHTTTTEKTDHKATKSHLSDSSPTTHTTTKKTATEKTDHKATKSHLSDSSPTTHTTTKKTATEKTDHKATKSHLSDSSPTTHTTTKKTATEKTDHKATKSHLSDSSPTTHTTTKKTATEKTDLKTTKRTIPQQVSLTCNCNGGLKCQHDHCLITAPNVFCVTTAEQNTLEKAKGKPRSALNQTCQENYDFCNTDITITLNEDVYWRSSTKCCNDSNNCNSASVKAPQPSTTTGNRVCPSCFALNATDCTPTDMNCVESETKCINVTGTVNNGTSTSRFVGRGCASDSVMKIKNDSTLVFGTNTYHFTSITADASQTLGSVPFIFLLSSFLGLLQAKFYY